MDLTSLAIRNNRTTAVIVFGIVLAGLLTYFQLPRAEDPGFTIRTAQILTIFPGASPERVEMLVTEPLEEAIKQMPELSFVTSTSKTGVSIVFVNIEERYRDMRPIWDDLRRKVEAVKPDLPAGIIGPDVNDDFGDVYGIIVTLVGEGYSFAELDEVAENVRDELLRLPDAGKVVVSGGQDERIFVEYNNARLAESGLNPFALVQILQSRNIIIPGGQVNVGPERIALEPSGNFESLQELKHTVITLPGRGVIYLEDIADVRRGYVDPPRAKVYADGEPALALAVSLRDGGNITDLGDQVKATIALLEARYPIGIELGLAAFQPDQVNKKVDDFVGSLVQSVAIVLAVMLLTLGFRTGILVSSLIPATMLASLVLMSFFDIGLDQISLASLIIALGMLVDNAIVMSESVMVQMEQGKSASEAAIDSAKELRIPLLVASLTTAASFLPIYLAKSTVGEYTKSIFEVVSIALMTSWVLSLTMIPLLCTIFLKVRKVAAEEPFDSRFYRTYRRGLLFALHHRALTLVGTALVFVGVMSLFPKIPFQFFPPADRPLMTVELRMPIGTNIETTDHIVREFQDWLTSKKGEGGVVGFTSWVGEGAPRYFLGYAPEPPSPDYAYFLVNTSTFDHIAALRTEGEEFLAGRHPDLTAKLDVLKYGPPVKNALEVRLSGRDRDRLFEQVRAVKVKMESISGVRNVTDDWGPMAKKVVVDVNQARARRAGTSNQEIAVSLQTVLSGLDTTEYRENDNIIPITLRSVSADRQDFGKIESLSVYSQATGASVPLKQVADLKVVWEPAKILRRNQLETVTIAAALAQGTSSRDVNQVLRPWLDEQSASWPIGSDFAIGGEAEESGKANTSIMDQLPIAGLIILILLVGQFNSVRKAMIVSLTIPLGVIGVILGLLITRSYFGFMTLLGIISLAGIVINNAIVLLDRINLEIAGGSTEAQAVLHAGQLRLRPILLTTATTIGGLIPLWYGGGAMFEPMAIAIIFGLGFSTVLTLGVVPVLYSLLFRVSFADVKS